MARDVSVLKITDGASGTSGRHFFIEWLDEVGDQESARFFGDTASRMSETLAAKRLESEASYNSYLLGLIHGYRLRGRG